MQFLQKFGKPTSTKQNSQSQSFDEPFMEDALRIVILQNNLLNAADCANCACVSRSWRDTVQPFAPANLVFRQFGLFEYKKQVRQFAAMLRSPHYAEGSRICGAVAVACGSSLTRQRPIFQRHDAPSHVWDVKRLKNFAHLLEAVPGSCTALALNSGAAETLCGLGLYNNHRLMQQLKKRGMVLTCPIKLRLEAATDMQFGASEVLKSFIEIVGEASAATTLVQLELVLPHPSGVINEARMPEAKVNMAPALPLLPALTDVTMDDHALEVNSHSCSASNEPVAALEALASLPALKRLRCRRGTIAVFQRNLELGFSKLQQLVERLEVCDLEGTKFLAMTPRAADSALLTFVAATNLRRLQLDASACHFWDGALPPAVEVFGIQPEWLEEANCNGGWQFDQRTILPTSLRQLSLVDFCAVLAEPVDSAAPQLEVCLTVSGLRRWGDHPMPELQSWLLQRTTELRMTATPGLSQLSSLGSLPQLRSLVATGLNLAPAQLAASKPLQQMVSTPWWPRLQRMQIAGVVRDEVLDLRACTQLTWLHCSGPAGFRNGRTLAELPRALLPPNVVTLCLASLKSQSGEEAKRLPEWFVQLPQLRRLQMSGCMLQRARGFEWLIPGLGLSQSLLELRLLHRTRPPSNLDQTGTETYVHLLEQSKLTSLTVAAPPPRLATSDFWRVAAMLRSAGRVNVDTTGSFLSEF